ncbi:g11417 [Coccomyxa elongata]
MAIDALKADGRVAHLYAGPTGGRMCVIPAGWHHAAFNLRPTVSLNITHVTGMRALADGLIATAREYPDLHKSPMFGLGFHDLLECMVKLLLALPTATVLDQDSGMEDQNLVMSALELVSREEAYGERVYAEDVS